MSLTDKYDLEKVDYGTGGWNAILTAGMEKLDGFIHTYIEGQLGEMISAFRACYIGSDGRWYRAQADSLLHMPAFGISIEGGNENDTIRFQRIGPMENGDWDWTTGKLLYLDNAEAGELTHTRPPRQQIMGVALSSNRIFVKIEIPLLNYGTVTTTTTVAPVITTTTV